MQSAVINNHDQCAGFVHNELGFPNAFLTEEHRESGTEDLSGERFWGGPAGHPILHFRVAGQVWGDAEMASTPGAEAAHRLDKFFAGTGEGAGDLVGSSSSRMPEVIPIGTFRLVRGISFRELY
jgi:hypothetical protein